MSDSETEEIVDNVNNESVDWGGCIDVPEAAEEVKAQQPLSSLYTIQEESYLSTVASRPRSVVAPTVPATLDKNASRSFTDDGLASSFQAPNMTSNSAEFCKNVDGIRQMMEEEQAAFDTSGRRLDLPSNFNPNHFRGENNSWDKGPYQWDVKQTASPRLVQSNPDHLEQLQPAGVVKLTMDNTQKNSPEAPVTPAKSRKFEAKITPVRPAQERVTALRDRNSPRLSVVTATSTPKGAERATSRLPDWEVSAINANNTTAADNTTGVEMPPEFLASVLSSMPPNAPTSDIMATVERLRCARVQKSTQRAEAREKFRNDTASSRMEERKTTTMLGTRNLDRRPPMNPVVRLPTVEEERMDSSRVSSRSNSRQTTAGATDQNEANTAHRRNSDPLTSHPPTDHTNPLLSRAPSQAISRASSTMSLFRTDTRLSSASSSNKMLRVTGTTGKILAFGPCEKGMELVKTIILTNLLDRAIRVTAELSKGEKGAYRILEGRLSNIGPKESTPLRIEFKPLSSHRHNNTLYIKSNCSQAGQYSIALRGMGGMASIELLPNENLHMTTKGYVIKKNALYGTYNFQLKSVGSLAFCKVVVTTCDTYPVEAKISPTPYVILKTGQIQNFTVEISPTEAAKLRNLPIVDKDDPFVSLEVKFFWGDEYFRQRAMEYLKKKGEQHLNGSFHVAETYLNEKKFVEPADYTCNISDVSLFESGLCSHIVKVISAQPRASRVSMHLTESTLKPDDTLACLMSNDRERTIVRDYNDTTYMT